MFPLLPGLPFFVPMYLPQFEWMIYGPNGMAKTLQETLSGQMQHEYFPVRLGDMGSRVKFHGLNEDTKKGFWLGEEGAPTSIKVTSKYLNHSVLTLGYKLEEFARIPQSDDSLSNGGKSMAKRGVSVAYITDHEPFDHSLAKGGGFTPLDSAIIGNAHRLSADHSHAQFFKDVDILFHDAQYLFSEYAPTSGAMSKEYWGHSTVEYVVEVAFYANVKTLLLFHHDPQRTDDQMDDLVLYATKKAEELEKEFGEIMTSLGSVDRVPMKVIGSRERDIYELDPFKFIEDDCHVENLSHSHNGTSVFQSPPLMTTHCHNLNQKVILGLCPIKHSTSCQVLTENSFEVTLSQWSPDIIELAKSTQPSIIILDENLFGSSVFEICEEIRKDGAWGEYVNLFIIAAPKANDDISVSEKAKEQDILERLNVAEFIQGPFSPSYLLTRIQVSLLRMPLRWQRPPLVRHESQRILALQGTGLLDTNPEERFDRITRLTAAMFNATMSTISLVDSDRVWLKSKVGLNATSFPRDNAVCSHAILNKDVMVINDILQDERFADMPCGNARFYAGCPIRIPSSDGDKAIGVLCILDYKPRDLNEDEIKLLNDFAAMVQREIMDTHPR